ncbi:MAG: SlyX family protein [Betaproteobacteria bacterium]|nr:SlyX family protein [Betaproteobacteria bacterium]
MCEERLVNIEIKLAYQEDQIEALNRTVYAQEQRLAQLETVLVTLAQQLRTLSEAGGEGPGASERPPHY